MNQRWTSQKLFVSTKFKFKCNTPDGVPAFGTYKGVRVGIIRTNGQIATVFPDHEQID